MSASEFLSRVPNIFKANALWTTALFSEPPDFEPGDPLTGRPIHCFDTKRVLRSRTGILSRADPFLWVKDDELFVFMEAEPEIGPGRIEAWVTNDLRRFSWLGDVLREPFHLSYPFLFDFGGRPHMLPESSESGRLILYEFNPFPVRVRPVRQLLEGPYLDSSIIEIDGNWFLFTTSPEGLEIFVTDNLLNGGLRRHPDSPITNDARIRRSGGGVFRTAHGLRRIAQDCSEVYGANLNLIAIDEITPDTYSERVIDEHIYPCDRPWNRLGIHHLSYVRFRDRTIVAIDGRQRDHYVHRLRGLAWRAVGL